LSGRFNIAGAFHIGLSDDILESPLKFLSQVYVLWGVNEQYHVCPCCGVLLLSELRAGNL
jgi:hypothetical protein